MEYLIIFTLIVYLLIKCVELFGSNGKRQTQKQTKYKDSAYYKQTRNPYWKVMRDPGLLGEYRLYQQLRKVKGYKKFLFNVYLNKEDGSTTEIDMIMLHETGIYVFESKNYHGWIFGSENNKFWTAMYKTGRRYYRGTEKHKFFNPIWQNKLHIRILGNYIKQNVYVASYIIFGNGATLKDITVNSKNVYLLKRNEVVDTLMYSMQDTEKCLDKESIKEIYNTLYPMTQVSDEVKQQHIKEIELHKAEK